MSNLIIKYIGVITFDQIEEILTMYNQNMPMTNSPLCRTRLFSIMVECLENAYRHSYKGNEQDTKIELYLTQNNNTFELSVTNAVSNNELKAFTTRIDELNGYDLATIKSIYNETILKVRISEKGGAGLGLLKILRSARNPFAYKVTPINNEYSLINLSIKISDQKK